MESSLVKCSKCQATLMPECYNAGELKPCPSCDAALSIEVFPAILQTTSAKPAETVMTEGESSCFYHSTKKASIVCDGCGRFLCALCDLELNGRHLCPVCLESGQKKAKYKDLENTRVLWDQLALGVALAPLICFWPSLIGGPIALYLVLRHRKDPGSITGKSNVTMMAAAVIAILEIIGWTVGLIFVATR